MKTNTLPFLMNDYSRSTASPTHEEIEVCAYFIYVQEGWPEGRALDHWLQAELQLSATRMHEAARELCSVSTNENSG